MTDRFTNLRTFLGKKPPLPKDPTIKSFSFGEDPYKEKTELSKQISNAIKEVFLPKPPAKKLLPVEEPTPEPLPEPTPEPKKKPIPSNVGKKYTCRICKSQGKSGEGHTAKGHEKFLLGLALPKKKEQEPKTETNIPAEIPPPAPTLTVVEPVQAPTPPAPPKVQYNPSEFCLHCRVKGHLQSNCSKKTKALKEIEEKKLFEEAIQGPIAPNQRGYEEALILAQKEDWGAAWELLSRMLEGDLSLITYRNEAKKQGGVKALLRVLQIRLGIGVKAPHEEPEAIQKQISVVATFAFVGFSREAQPIIRGLLRRETPIFLDNTEEDELKLEAKKGTIQAVICRGWNEPLKEYARSLAKSLDLSTVWVASETKKKLDYAIQHTRKYIRRGSQNSRRH
jgi:hypothetical protein